VVLYRQIAVVNAANRNRAVDTRRECIRPVQSTRRYAVEYLRGSIIPIMAADRIVAHQACFAAGRVGTPSSDVADASAATSWRDGNHIVEIATDLQAFAGGLVPEPEFVSWNARK